MDRYLGDLVATRPPLAFLIYMSFYTRYPDQIEFFL